MLDGFELLQPLGRGGMGVVWLARNPHTGQQVALKVIYTAGGADADAVEPAS